jgi:hypothetical protein
VIITEPRASRRRGTPSWIRVRVDDEPTSRCARAMLLRRIQCLCIAMYDVMLTAMIVVIVCISLPLRRASPLLAVSAT